MRQDLLRNVEQPETGAPGMGGSEVLRALLVKKLFGLIYEELAFHLADSRTFGTFCGYGGWRTCRPGRSLAENIGRVRPEIWRELNWAIGRYALKEGVEEGRLRVRGSTPWSRRRTSTSPGTATSCSTASGCSPGCWRRPRSDSASPSTATTRSGQSGACRRSSTRERPPSGRTSTGTYFRVARRVRGYADRAVLFLEGEPAEERAKARRLVSRLRRFGDLLEQVIDQTTRRVLEGKRVPAAEKVLSIFEPHTDLIVEENRAVEFGHKVFLSSGPSGLILDCEVADGNPADSTRAVSLLERHRDLYGAVPKQAAFDGGFASRANLEAAQELGVRDVAFHKKRGLEVGKMVRSSWIYKRLQNFRAGIEGTISFLKRAFGLDRCTWKGAAGFRAYVHRSVLAANLLMLVRQMRT